MHKETVMKRELERMIEQIDAGDNIKIFNAKKALYIPVEANFKKTIRDYLVGKLNEIKFKESINGE